jgi:cold shock CspA family protein
VHVLIALKDPSDPEKMDKAERLTKHQQYKRYNKREDFVLPFEWLHPKNGRHIESIDCLLHHDDLIKGTNNVSKSDKRKPIEGSLFEKNITQWEGTITAVRSEWQGTITFKGRLPVRFVPLNAQPSMPSLGDTVTFCLSFDGYGLSAWRVVLNAGTQPGGLSDIVGRDDDSSSDYSEQEDVEKENFLVAPSLCSIDIQEPDEKHGLDEQKDQRPHAGAVLKKRTKTHWDEYNEKRMQGVVSFTNPDTGFGFIENADVEDKLFFHASQLREPVTNLEGNIYKDMLLDFKVEKLTERTRAADIRVLEVRKYKINFLP